MVSVNQENALDELDREVLHKMMETLGYSDTFHCVKSVRIRSYSGPHFAK